jgi:thymidine kinase
MRGAGGGGKSGGGKSGGGKSGGGNNGGGKSGGGNNGGGGQPADPASGPVGPPNASGSASALSAVPAAGSGRGRFAGGTVKFFHGPMDCGKSTLALQLHYNHSRQGRSGLLLTKLDRSGPARISSRIGISRSAVEVTDDQDIVDLVRGVWANGQRVDYLIVDEAQFFTADQVDQLAVLADDSQVDVFAFGIATDFRGRLFPGSARLFEVADEVAPLQVEVLCWCGRIGRFNGRVVNGRIVREGATVVVADTGDSPPDAGTVRYQVLCRIHHRSGELGPATADDTRPQNRSPEPLDQTAAPCVPAVRPADQDTQPLNWATEPLD